MKNTVVKVTIRDYLGNPDVSREYSGLEFFDEQETIISFQVPPYLSSVTISMQTQVFNVTENKMQTFHANDKAFHVLKHERSNN